MRSPYLLALPLLLAASCVQADPPKPDFANLPVYLKALNRATDPEALAIRLRIADGPANLIREQAAAEKAGLLTRADQFQPPLPPADQNAAPLYDQLKTLRKQKPLHLPSYAQPLNGRYAYTPEQIAVVQKEYDARQDIFSLLHQAADRPQFVFAADYSNPLAMSMLFQYAAGLRESAREVSTESLLLAYRGRFSEAITSQERGFRVARQAAIQPLLISFLVGSAIDSITLTGMQNILDLAGPNAALDSRAEADIRALPPLSLSHALSGEPAQSAGEFSILRQAQPSEFAGVFADDTKFVGKHHLPVAVRFTSAEKAQISHLLDAAQADYLHQMRRLVATADLPDTDRQAAFGLAEARAQANHSDPIQALSDLLNPVIGADAIMASTPSLGRLTQQAGRVTARRLVAAAGASVLAEKARTNAFPSALPAAFIDPFTHKPLGYRLEGANGFVVYSAGPTGAFDGSKPGDKWNGANTVFRYPLVPVSVPEDMLK